MILSSGAVQSIDKNLIEIGQGWVYSSLPIWNPDYSEELEQPVSVSAVTLGEMRFLGEKTVIVIRDEPNEASRVIWSGIVPLLEDSAGGGSTPGATQHNDILGRSASNAHPITAITGLADALASAAVATAANIETFPRGDIVWQTDPGGLWDSGLCFVHLFPVVGKTRIVHLDFQFAQAGSGWDGAWAIWGGIDSTSTWTILAQGYLPNTSKGLVRYALPTALDISAYDSIALAQDPGAAGLAQPVRQASVYYSPASPSGLPAAYSYLGTHTHGAVFSALPVIPAADPVYLMQKWSSIGVR